MQITKKQFIIFVVGLVIIFSFCVPWQDGGNGYYDNLKFHSILWNYNNESPSINMMLFTLICALWCVVFYAYTKTK